MSETWIVPLLAGIVTGLLSWLVLATLFSDERRVARRVRKMSSSEYAQAGEIEPLSRSFNDRVVGTLGAKASAGMHSLLPGPYSERLALKIRLAGPTRGMTPELFVLAKIVLAILGLVLGLVVASRPAIAPWLAIGAVALGVAAGFFGPDAWLDSRIGSRQNAIRRALPDMLDMLLVSVEAGLGFDASLGKVVAATTGPLSQEFSVVLQEIQSGMPRRDAMQHLATRTGVPELSAFIMAIVQADTFGVSVSNVLRQQAKEMRTKRRQRAEELAQKAPAKMVLPLILCILPATLVVVAGPAVIRIGQAFSGI
jgi:tight adherence protein C